MKKLPGLIIFLIVIIFIAYNAPNVYSADAKNVSEIQQLLQSGFENARTGKLDAAINDFNKVISLDKKNASAYAGLGNSYAQKGNPDKAIEYYNKAISLDDKNSFAYAGLGSSYAQKGNPDKAIEYYNKAISLNSKNPFTYYSLGSLYSSLNRKDDALKMLKILKDLNKNLADNLERQMQKPNIPAKPGK